MTGMAEPRRAPFDLRLAAVFYVSVIANGLLVYLDRTSDFGDSAIYWLLLVPLLILMVTTGYRLLREVFARRPGS